MKIKTVLLYAWIIYSFVSVYVFFKTRVNIRLWSLFGYDFGFSGLYSNLPIKITWLILFLTTYYAYSNDYSKETESVFAPLKFNKKKKQKLNQIKQTIKV